MARSARASVVAVVLAGLLGLAAAVAVPRVAQARTSAAGPVRNPVLLVHGFNGSGANWTALVGALRHAGWRADEIDAMSYDSSRSNKSIARQISDEVASLRLRTGAARVDVVSHSMGAISTRWYLEHLGGAASVGSWASLAGVNEGTVWAYGCYLLTPCREMTPESSVLTDLARNAASVRGPRLAAWWSPCDEAVVPQSNARLAGAANTETACLGHSALKSDPTVLAQVVGWLARQSS